MDPAASAGCCQHAGSVKKGWLRASAAVIRGVLGNQNDRVLAYTASLTVVLMLEQKFAMSNRDAC